MVYTRRGDEGRTDLGSGERVSKNSKRVETYGTIDELNSLTGICRNYVDGNSEKLEQVQNQLHILQAELSNMNPDKIIESKHIKLLEDWIDSFQEECPPLKAFVLAGGCESASHLHHARSVARRAERRVVELDSEEELRTEVLEYVNRLSDLYFMMARYENHVNDVEEKNPSY